MNRSFFKIFLGMFITFVSRRVMQQIDLIMLAPLGESEIAAYAIPMNINLVDFSIFMSIAIVMSVRLSKIHEYKDRLKSELANLFTLVLWLGIALSIISFFLYQYLIYLQVSDVQIRKLAYSSVPWCSITIIPDSMALILSMASFICHREYKASIISVTTVLIDALLNYIFVYSLGLGFAGIYISTLLSMVINCSLFIYILRDLISFKKIHAVINTTWLKHIIKQAYPETIRIILERGNIFALFWFINTQTLVIEKLSVFAVVTSVRLIFSMFVVSYSRSISIYLSKHYKSFSSLAQTWVAGVSIYGFIISILFSLSVHAGSDLLGQHVFRLSDPLSIEWWNAFCNVVIVILPLSFVSGVLRSIMNYLEKYKSIALIDLFCMWFILLPVLIFGLFIENPYVIWLSYLLDCIIFIFCSIIYVKKNHAHTI